MYGLSPPKLAPEGIEPETSRGANSKIPRELGGPSTSRIEQPHKQERHHTFTKNLKAIGLWVLLLIRCLTFTILSNVGHITHTCKPTIYLAFSIFRV
ncbi:transmembrane protein, putative [Medicago truncatula]|uniref:Transmembrane protein, putative n=1 Tax=Medicago truncatula TaxID=3880 RepID=G7KBF0_MEDTR|nr:transmembrane protein, putative [Medicago truncatula]